MFLSNANISIRSIGVSYPRSFIKVKKLEPVKEPRLNRNVSLTLFQENQGSIVMDR